MRIVYVTAALPFGTDEAFIVPEIQALLRCGHEILIVPRSPRGPLLHGRDLVGRARIAPLCSPRILKTAARVLARAPGRIAREIGAIVPAKTVKNLAILPKALWLADLARDWSADHIHCHWAGTTATMAMLASAVSHIPWSLTCHRWDIVENNLLARKVRRASFARFISQDGFAMARERGVRPGDHAAVIHMGVDLPRRPESLEVPARPAVALCPARLVSVKGHRYLLEAWCALKERGIQGELWLAGDGPLRAELETLARDWQLDRSVRFLGALPHEDLLAIYARNLVSTVVMSSIDLGRGCHEGIPVALIEAMSYAIPVIATRTGGTPELIRPGAGLLVPAADPIALAEAIESIFGNPPFARELGQRGRQRAFESFDVTQVAGVLAGAFAGEISVCSNV